MLPVASLQSSLSVADTAATLPLSNEGSVAIQLTGTWTGTVSFEATIGTDLSTATWFAANGIIPSTGVIATTATANGVWRVDSSGFRAVRARFSTATSGTVVADLRGAVGGPSVSGSILAPSAVSAVNLTQVASSSTGLAGAGAVGAATQRVVLATNTTVPNVSGTIADGATDSGNPVKVGARAIDPAAFPADLIAGQRADLLTDLGRRLIVYLGTTLDATNDFVSTNDKNGVVIRPTITVGASPNYAADDVVGGIITLSNVMAVSGRPALLKSVILKDAAGQGPALSLFFLRDTPAGGTYTDNAAIVWGSTGEGDSARRVGLVRVTAGDWYTVAGQSTVVLGGIEQLMGAAALDLFLLIIADGAYNAAASTDLTAEIAFERR